MSNPIDNQPPAGARPAAPFRIAMDDASHTGARIKVIGVGGGGSNAVNRMVREGFDGVEFIVANTDVQALRMNAASIKLQLGEKLTKGLGAGADPTVGRHAALEDTDKLIQALDGADLVFVTTGLGGGTGTGAAPVIASLASELGALTIAVVTQPFTFEGRKRAIQAERGLEELRDCVDSVITIPNERLLSTIDRKTPLLDAFAAADDVLRQAIQGISDLILVPGLINLDFADVKTIMTGMGVAVMGTGVGHGDDPRRGRRQEGDFEPAARGRVHRRRARRDHQRHRRLRPVAGRGQRGVDDHPRGRPRGRQHHLRRRHRPEARRPGEDHGHRHRLRPARRAGGGAGRRRRTRPVDLSNYTSWLGGEGTSRLAIARRHGVGVAAPAAGVPLAMTIDPAAGQDGAARRGRRGGGRRPRRAGLPAPGEAGLTSGTWYSAYIHGILDRRRLSARFLSAGVGAARMPGDGARTHGQDLLATISHRTLLAREVGYVRKPHAGRLRVALAFPNTYCVGMSNLGFQTVYRLFNALDDVVCERVFLPPKQELAAALERPGVARRRVESQTPVRDFDVFAFSVSFEWDYTNVVTLLRLAGLPLYAAERSARHPLVVIGGAVTFVNPEPLAPFADVIAAGEGEVLVPALVRADRRRGRPGRTARSARP